MFSTIGLQIIKNEITIDPAAVGYAGEPALRQAELMNTLFPQSPKVYVKSPVSPQRVVDVLVRRLKWKVITAATSTNTSAFYFVELCKLNELPIDSTDPDVVTLVNNLVTAGLLASADVTALNDLTKVEVLKSRADLTIGSLVTADDITAALALP